MLWLQWKYEPLDFLIRKGRDAEALTFVQMIYDVPAEKNIAKTDKDARKQYFTEYIGLRRAEL